MPVAVCNNMLEEISVQAAETGSASDAVHLKKSRGRGIILGLIANFMTH